MARRCRSGYSQAVHRVLDEHLRAEVILEKQSVSGRGEPHDELVRGTLSLGRGDEHRVAGESGRRAR